MPIVNRRYQLLDAIDQDFYGVYYKAIDLANNKAIVRLKLLNEDYFIEELYTQYSRMFINYASIRHPHLLSAFRFDIVRAKGNQIADKVEYFFVAEYYNIERLIKYEKLNSTQQFKVIIQLLYVIRYLHFKGFYYGRIAPQNMLITIDDKGDICLKLRDLPSVLTSSNKRFLDEDTRFFAPEVIKGETACAQSDIFSISKFLLDYFKGAAESKVSKSVEGLVKALLKNSDEKIDNRTETLLELIEMLISARLCEMPFKDRAYYDRVNFNLAIISRDRELDFINGCIDERLSHLKGCKGIIVSGVKGIGKSRLAQEIYFNQRTKGKHVLKTVVHSVSDSHFTAFSKLIKDLIAQIEVPQSLIEKYGSEIVKIVPELVDLWQVEPTKPLVITSEILRLNNRIVRFVLELASTYKLVIILENIDLYNENEKVILQMLMGYESALPLFIIATCVRAENYLSRYDFYDFLDLSALTKWDVKAFLKSVFHFKEKEHLEDLSHIVFESSFGNPRAIEGVLKQMFYEQCLYVGEERRWHIDYDKISKIDFVEHAEEALIKSFEKLSKSEQFILRVLSAFSVAPRKALLYHFTDLTKTEFDYALDRLTKMKVVHLEQTIVGYSISFYNREYKKIIYYKIDKPFKILLHKKIATRIKTHYLVQNLYKEEYLHHLVASNQSVEAVSFATELGDKMFDNGLLESALKYYAIALSNRDANDISLNINLLKRLADIRFKLGDTKNATLLYEKLAKLALSHHYLRDYIDCQIRILELRLKRKDYRDIRQHFDEIINKAKAIDYYQGVLGVVFHVFRYYTAIGDMIKSEEALKTMQDYVKYVDNDDYRGRYLVVKGIFNDLNKDYHTAFLSFKQAIDYLERGDNYFELSVVYNNLGVLSYEILGNLQEAKAYFKKAINILNKHRIVVDKNIYLSNLGESLTKEGKYNQAIEKLNEALELSIETDDIDGKVTSIALLVEVHVQMAYYQKAYHYLEQLKAMLSTYQYGEYVADNLRVFYALTLFYFKLYNFKLANVHLNKAIEERTDAIDHLSNFRLRILKFEIVYFSTSNRLVFAVDYDYLDNLVSLSVQPIERQIISEAILDIILDMMCFDNRTTIDKLINYYQQIKPKSDNAKIILREKLMALYIERSKGMMSFGDAIKESEVTISIREKWKIYFVIANFASLRGDYFKGLQYYLEAIDIIKRQYDDLAQPLRRDYIENDTLKHYLYSCVQVVLEKLKVSYSMPKTFNKEAFFNLDPIDKVLNTDAFRASINKTYAQKYNTSFETLADLSAAFTADHAYNIILLLRFISQSALADNVYFFILNDESEIDKIFKADQNVENIDFSMLKNRYPNRARITLINSNVLAERGIIDIKAEMFIPVSTASYDEAYSDENRRKDHVENNALTIGYIYLYSTSRLNNINTQLENEIEKLKSFIYLIVENYRLYKMSTIDKLTGIYLRKHIEKAFDNQMRMCKKLNESLSVAMLDIDHFKSVNDTYGHRKGDEVLKKIAQIILKSVRSKDLVGRYGGEEFIIVLPRADGKEAYEISERVRKNVENAVLLGDDRKVTISSGIATAPEMGATEAELIEKADRALYASKENGRNKTTIYNANNQRKTRRYDKLTGILSGNMANDTRRIKAIVDLLDVVADESDYINKIYFVLQTILDITEGREIALLKIYDGKAYLYSCMRGDDNIKQKILLEDEKTIFEEDPDGYYIKWNDFSDIDKITGKPNWKSYILRDLIVSGVQKGRLIISVPIEEKEFNFNDYNFVNHICGIISAIV